MHILVLYLIVYLLYVLFLPTKPRGALDCRAKAVNEEMKRAATYAIAALAKRPMMKRRTPSAGDLINLAAANQTAAAAGAGSSASDSSSTLSTDVSVPGSVGSGGSSASGRSRSPQKCGPAAGLRVEHKHTNSGGKHLGHLRRKSYGEGCFYTATDGDAAQPKFGRQ